MTPAKIKKVKSTRPFANTHASRMEGVIGRAMKTDALNNGHIARMPGGSQRKPPVPKPKPSAKPRHSEVLALMQSGTRQCDIARILGVTYATVKSDVFILRRAGRL